MLKSKRVENHNFFGFHTICSSNFGGNLFSHRSINLLAETSRTECMSADASDIQTKAFKNVDSLIKKIKPKKIVKNDRGEKVKKTIYSSLESDGVWFDRKRSRDSTCTTCSCKWRAFTSYRPPRNCKIRDRSEVISYM